MPSERLLAPLGLTDEDERVYRFLLAHPSSLPTDIAAATGIAARSVTRSLRNLTARGLVSVGAGHPARYLAAPPDAAVEALVLQREEELQRVRAATARLLDDFRRGVGTGSAHEVVELVHGREAIAQRLGQMRAGARSEMLGLDKPPYVTVDLNAATPPPAVRPGISYRTVYHPDSLKIPGRLEILRVELTAGEHGRVYDVPMKMLVMDRRLALVPLNTDLRKSEGSALVVHPSTLLDSLLTLFETIWERAAPLRLDGTLQESEGGLSAEEAQLLSLLLAGLTEDAIARTLHVARRTVQRRVEALMARVGAQNRLQLVRHAVLRGWL